ncbi:MAG TPA: hypothetical protein VIF59_06425 [Methylomirabilota bacterium]|jgi:hypothetical protein
MSRLVVTLALALAATACAPQAEPRTVIGAGPRVVFDDDLRAARHWSAASGAICRSAYSDGGLAVENVAASTTASCLLPPVRPEVFPARVRIEITARLRKGTRESPYGLMFASRGGGDTRSFSTFGLTANGTYRVSSWSGGKWSYPVPPTFSPSVKTDYGAPNTLAVELRERSVVAYINGRPVATAELPGDAGGALGLYVDQRGMEVLFSNLRVSELPALR